jgi:hypothetical protein
LSKNIIDKIDLVIGDELGLSAEGKDFFLNFEIKYRMGGSDEEE